MFRYFWWAAAFSLAGSLLAQSSDRDQQFRDDLHYLATELPKRHINPFHQISAAQFQSAVSALDRDIPLIGDTEIMVRMAQIVASIGEAHTSLALPQGPTPFRWFPFTFYGFEDGWRVNAVRSDLAQLLGCRIVQIGDTPIEEVVREARDGHLPRERPVVEAAVPQLCHVCRRPEDGGRHCEPRLGAVDL